MAGELSQRIHSNFSTDVATWSGFRDEITGAYINDQGTGAAYVDYSDHLIREYNDKINDLNFSKELLIEPMDAGFRYVNDPLVGAFHSGLHSCFSARTIGFGGPLVRVRRASDNVEVDVRGNENGELSLGSPVIDETENLLPYSEDISQWDETDGLFTKNITGGDSPLNPSTGHQFASTNIDRIVDGKLTGKLSSNWVSSNSSLVSANAYVSGAELIQNTNFERNANNWTPQDGNISVVADNLVSVPTYQTGANIVANGTFAGAGNWSKSADPIVVIANGVATFTVTDGGYAFLSQGISLLSGRQYRVEATVSGTAGKALRVMDNTSDLGTLKSSETEFTFDGTDQNISFDWTAGSNSNAIQFVRKGVGDFSFTVDDVYVYQTNATNMSRIGLIDDPDFGQEAAAMRETAGTGEHSFQFDADAYDFALPTGVKVTASSFVRSVGGRNVELTFFNGLNNLSSSKSARFELTGNGTVAFSDGDAATIVPIVNDYYKVNFQLTTPTTSVGAADKPYVRFRLLRDDTNLVTYSEDFSQWNNVNTTLTAGQLDPFGGTDATIFTPSADGTDRREILTSVTGGTTYFGSVFVATGTSDNFQFQFVDNEHSYANRGLLKVDIGTDGSFSTNAATALASNITYTPSSNGFTRVSFSFTPSASTDQLSFRLFPDRDHGTATTTFFGAQLSDEDTLPDYAKTNGSTITSTGWAGDTGKGIDQFQLRVFEGTETRGRVLPTSTSSYVFQPFATESGKQYRISASGSRSLETGFATNLVTNGAFASDSNWSKSANAAIADGKATVTIITGEAGQISQNLTYTNGRTYRLRADVSGTSGALLRVQDESSNNGGLTSANGTISLDGTNQTVDVSWQANANSDKINFARSLAVGDTPSLWPTGKAVFDFSSNGGWSIGTNWSIDTSAGVAKRVGGGDGTNLGYAAWVFESGVTYKVKLDITTLADSTCNVYDTVNGITYHNFTSVGNNQTATFTATGNGAFGLRSSSTDLVVDNLTIASGGQFSVDNVYVYQPNATQVQLQALDNANSNDHIASSTAVTNGEMSKDFTAISDTSAIALLVDDNAVPSAGFFTNCSAKEIVYKAAWNTTDTQTLTQADKLGTIGGKKYIIKFSISDYESGAIKLSQPTPSEETLFSADGTYEVEVINDAQLGGFNDVQFKNQGTTNLKITDISAIESLPVAPYYQVYSVSGDENKILAESTETLSVKSGDIFTASVYAKNVHTADGNLLLQLNRAVGGAFEETFQSLDAASTDSWQRFTAIHEFTGTHTKLRARLFAPDDATTSGQIFGFQLNRGSGAESYIRTEGSPITKEKAPAPLKDFLYGSELVTDTKLRDSSQWSSQSTAGAVSFGDRGATFTITDGNYAKLKQNITYEVGKTYIATINAVGVSGTKHRVQDDDGNAGGLSNTVFFDFDGTNQTLTFPFVATADSDSIMLTRGTDGGRTYSTLVKSISVREYEDAFCTLWYDQSNFGTKPERNFQQPTAAYQPAITFSGTIPTGANGKPGVRWDFGKNMYMSSEFSGSAGSLIDAFFVSDLDVSDVTGIFRQKHIYFTSTGNENYIIMESGNSATSIGALGNSNKTLRVNGVDYNPADPDLTRDDVFELLDHNKLYSIVGGVSSNYTGTHDNILNLGFYQSNPATSFNFEGLMQETIIYTGSQFTTRTGIEKNMNDHYGMF